MKYQTRLVSHCLALILLLCGWLMAPAPGLAQQGVLIEILEPLEEGAAVLQSIGNAAIDQPFQGRVSVRFKVTNATALPILISKVEILGHRVSTFVQPIHIAPGSFKIFQNCLCEGWRPLVIDAPFPENLQLSVFLATHVSPFVETVPLRSHSHPGGPMTFIGKESDLRMQEAWAASSNHFADHQVFALDTAVRGWDGADWLETFPEVDGNRKEHYRVYGMPVYAVADGTVCWALNDHEERPTVADSPTISPSLGHFDAGGNQIFIDHGTEISVVAHLQPGSIPNELLTPGVQVRRGQYLGKVGLSGATSHPHTHIHVKTTPSLAPQSDRPRNGCDDGWFRPMLFGGWQSLTLAEATQLAQDNTLNSEHWTMLTQHSAPDPPSLLYPSLDNYSFCSDCLDSRQYIGVFRGADHIDLRVKRAGWSAFTQKWSELSEDQFRLVEINTFVENGERQFLGVFQRGVGGHYLWNVTGWEAFVGKWRELSENGLRLIDLATHPVGNRRQYIGVYREGTDGYYLWSANGWNAFTEKWAELSEQGFRLIDIETFAVGNQRQYIGVYRSGNDSHYLWSVTGWEAFTKKWSELNGQGLRLIDIETFAVGNQRQFIGVFRAGQDSYGLYSITSYEAFLQLWEGLNSKGLRIVDIHVEP